MERLLKLFLVFTILFSLYVPTHSYEINENIGTVVYTVYLDNTTTINGTAPNFFSNVSPTYMTIGPSNDVYVVAVDRIYVLSPYGKIIKTLPVPGAEYASYCPENQTVIVSSGTLPQHTISLIYKNFTVRTLRVRDYYPISVYPLHDKVYVGTFNGIGILEGENLSIIYRTPGPVVSLTSANGVIYGVGYNLTGNFGFLVSVGNETRTFRIYTFPNYVCVYNNHLYVAADISMITVNLESLYMRYVNVNGEKFEGVAFDSRNNLTYATADSLIGPDYVLVMKGDQVLGKIYVGITPVGIAFDPESGLIFVANFFDGTISVISPSVTQIQIERNVTTTQLGGEHSAPEPSPNYYIQNTVLILLVIIFTFVIVKSLRKMRHETKSDS